MANYNSIHTGREIDLGIGDITSILSVAAGSDDNGNEKFEHIDTSNITDAVQVPQTSATETYILKLIANESGTGSMFKLRFVPENET